MSPPSSGSWLPGGSPWQPSERRDSAAAQGLSRAGGPGARFANDAEILSPRWRYHPGDPTLLLGYHLGQLIGLADDDRHALTIAGNRAGKGISLIVPNACLWPASAVILDPKGELARMTARARRQLHGQEVVLLDPFGMSGQQPQGSCNILDMIDLNSPFAPADIMILVEALIATSKDTSNGQYFSAAARNLVTALIVFAKIKFSRPTLTNVWDLLSGRFGTLAGSMREPSDVFALMLASDALNGTVRAMARTWLEIPYKEQGSILATARTALQFLEGFGHPDAAMARVSAPSSFTPADLKRKRITVYICLPASYMGVYRAWMRLFVNMVLVAMEMTPTVGGAPVLMLLDEAATLGYLPMLEQAAGLMAGHGVKLWLHFQNLRQIETAYGRNWEAFVSNAGVSTWFGIGGDAMATDYLTKRLGMTQYYEREEPGGTFMSRAQAGYLQGGPGKWVSSPLAYGHELELRLARENGVLLALSPGTPPMILQRNNILNGFLKGMIDA